MWSKYIVCGVGVSCDFTLPDPPLSLQEEVLGLHYCVGRTLTFQEVRIAYVDTPSLHVQATIRHHCSVKVKGNE